MTREFRHTEDLAAEAIWGNGDDQPGSINELCTLLAGNPTTADLVKAETAAKCLLTSISAWRSSRRLVEAAPHRCPVISREEIDEARNCRSAYF